MGKKPLQVSIIPLILILFIILAIGGCCGKKMFEKASATAQMQTTTVEETTVVQEPAPPPEPVPMMALDPIYFEFDRSNLTPDAIATLNKIAVVLKQSPAMKIRIGGNCDERGTNEYNMALGERRAVSVMRHLATMGIAADRMSTISYGEERPIDSGHNESAWAKNRRDDFTAAQ
jgi:peptidoglycan-associated lipoprotein